jgi:hypothetical protein
VKAVPDKLLKLSRVTVMSTSGELHIFGMSIPTS